MGMHMKWLLSSLEDRIGKKALKFYFIYIIYLKA
jgi:hypothetical protein